MKIYIATSGSYSDYHIEKVFTNKEQAEKFVEFYNGKPYDYDEMQLEVYDTIDETKHASDYIEITYFATSPKPFSWEEEQDVKPYFCDFEVDIEKKEEAIVYNYAHNGLSVNLIREVKGTREQAEKLYAKVAQDILAKFDYHMKSEGMSFEDTKKLLGY